MPLLVAELLFFLRIEGIVAVENKGMRILDFDDVIDRLIQKIAVVGDDQNSSLVIGKVRLKPAYGGDIQMVGGLVEQNDVRLFQKELGKGHSGFLTAGKCGDRLIKFLVLKAKSPQNAGDFTLVGEAVAALEARQKIVVFLDDAAQLCTGELGHQVLIPGDFLLQLDEVLFNIQKLFVDGAIHAKALILSQVADRGITGEGNAPLIGGQLAHHNL